MEIIAHFNEYHPDFDLDEITFFRFYVTTQNTHNNPSCSIYSFQQDLKPSTLQKQKKLIFQTIKIPNSLRDFCFLVVEAIFQDEDMRKQVIVFRESLELNQRIISLQNSVVFFKFEIEKKDSLQYFQRLHLNQLQFKCDLPKTSLTQQTMLSNLQLHLLMDNQQIIFSEEFCMELEHQNYFLDMPIPRQDNIKIVLTSQLFDSRIQLAELNLDISDLQVSKKQSCHFYQMSIPFVLTQKLVALIELVNYVKGPFSDNMKNDVNKENYSLLQSINNLCTMLTSDYAIHDTWTQDFINKPFKQILLVQNTTQIDFTESLEQISELLFHKQLTIFDIPQSWVYLIVQFQTRPKLANQNILCLLPIMQQQHTQNLVVQIIRANQKPIQTFEQTVESFKDRSFICSLQEQQGICQVRSFKGIDITQEFIEKLCTSLIITDDEKITICLFDLNLNVNFQNTIQFNSLLPITLGTKELQIQFNDVILQLLTQKLSNGNMLKTDKQQTKKQYQRDEQSEESDISNHGYKTRAKPILTERKYRHDDQPDMKLPMKKPYHRSQQEQLFLGSKEDSYSNYLLKAKEYLNLPVLEPLRPLSRSTYYSQQPTYEQETEQKPRRSSLSNQPKPLQDQPINSQTRMQQLYDDGRKTSRYQQMQQVAIERRKRLQQFKVGSWK